MTAARSAGPSRPAPAWRAALAQAGMELRLASRRGENLLVMAVIPTLILVFFSSVSVLPTGSGRPVDFLLPGVLALAVISTSLVNLGIATAYERSYGVLKRLGASPLSRGGLIGAKILTVLVIEAVQVGLLVAIAGIGFAWSPGDRASVGIVLAALLLGTLTFAGLGLAMAGALRAEATLAGANALFLVFLLLGGVIVPLDQLPGPVAALASILPAGALSDALRAGLGGGDPAGSLALLAAWGIAAATVATRTFRWE